MDTRALSVNFPLNTPTIIIDVELFIPIIADNEEKVVSIKTKALIDTGANSSCISERLALACKLRPVSALIIGMDILSKGDFAFSSNENESCFTFRIPSANQVIDFTKEKE